MISHNFARPVWPRLAHPKVTDWLVASEVIRNLGLVVAGAVGLSVAVWRGVSHDRQAKAALIQNRLSQSVERNNLFNTAVEQLTSERLAMRMGAIYTLIGLAGDHSELKTPIAGIFSAYLVEAADREIDMPDIQEVVHFLADQAGDVKDGD